ncbi:YvrJ family protein [Scopulibacillus cellulosilyticus]|uniref:YvrJ family protein n=1 Tax=Scopulibacillus cellulosilyticus TaxID=2665665 RepID=A0ABW2PXU9_9BACL
MDEWMPMIKDVGFPIVVTLYLLHRIEGKLDELNKSIQSLPNLFHPAERTYSEGRSQLNKRNGIEALDIVESSNKTV